MKKAPEAFRTISEVAEILETPAHVLRFWESKFYQIRPVKRAGGRRYYRPDDVALINGIRTLLQEQGMTIRGVQRVLQEQGAKHVATLGGALASIETEGDFETIDALALSDDATHESEPLDDILSVKDESGEGDSMADAEIEEADVDVVHLGDAAMEDCDGEALDIPVAPEVPLTTALPTSDETPDMVVEPEPETPQDTPIAVVTESTPPDVPVEKDTLPESPALVVAKDSPPLPLQPARNPILQDDMDAQDTQQVADRARYARSLRVMPRGQLGKDRDTYERLSRRIDTLLERMSEASGAGRW